MELNQIKSILIDLFKNDFSKKNRQRHNVYQRAVFFRLCRDLTPYALTDIGAVIDKDHASVLHGLKLFKNFKDWGEDIYLSIYNEARLKLKQRYDFANPHLNMTVEQRYKELFMNHIILKEKYYKTKQELDKMRNLELIEG
jgi:hypothetical protein|tara:strand:- start:277 stop:699 length:423 start_codon:yes stop_codon:yes gene_type:complete